MSIILPSKTLPDQKPFGKSFWGTPSQMEESYAPFVKSGRTITR